MKIILSLLACCVALSILPACYNTSLRAASTNKIRAVDTSGKTLEARFLTPDSFKRVPVDPSSFGTYLRQFPLKEAGSLVHLYDGRLKGNQGAAAAVLNLDVGNKDLQQCADAVMRLRAEYLFHIKKYAKIHFNFTNGFNAQYSKWALGYRIKVNGNNASWYKYTGTDYSYTTFKSYLEMVFSYAGSLSLSRELIPKVLDSIAPGDVFIQGGSPGHAIIVMDVANHLRTGQKIYMLAQSYMPAQEVHILVNPSDKTLSPWFTVNGEVEINTPEWTFRRNDLKSFAP